MKYIEINLPKEHIISQFGQQLIEKNTPKGDNYWKSMTVGTSETWCNIINPDTFKVTKIVAQLLYDYGFCVFDDFDEEDISVEFHCAKSTNETISSEFDIHSDSSGLISSGTHTGIHTCMCYFENTAEGGELGIYSSIMDKMDNPHTKLYTKPLQNHIKIIMFSDDLLHAPLPITNGIRIALSFQIRCGSC